MIVAKKKLRFHYINPSRARHSRWWILNPQWWIAYIAHDSFREFILLGLYISEVSYLVDIDDFKYEIKLATTFRKRLKAMLHI